MMARALGYLAVCVHYLTFLLSKTFPGIFPCCGLGSELSELLILEKVWLGPQWYSTTKYHLLFLAHTHPTMSQYLVSYLNGKLTGNFRQGTRLYIISALPEMLSFITHTTHLLQ